MLFPISVLAITNETSNPTQQNQVPPDMWFLFSLITAIGVIAAIIYPYLTNRNYRKHGDYERIIEIYKMIDTVEQRESRKRLYRAFMIYVTNHYKDGHRISGKVYKALNVYKNQELLDIYRDPLVLDEMELNEEDLLQDVERVRATFDHIGALFHTKLVPEKPLLRGLWGTGRVCWICLAQNIYIDRDRRKTLIYMDNFRYLFDRIEEYRDKRGLEPVEPF